MDRALDPELLKLALGEHEILPSPEEISGLLAQAELALLLQTPEVSDTLIGIGWYLHGVASSKYALQIYGVERQRAAFQVAGHIFDLLLGTPNLSRIDRLKYCFAAQIAYLRSTLDPNALAIYRREFATDLRDLSLLSHFREVALSCGIALLGFDVGYIYRVVRYIIAEVNNLVAEWEVDNILSTPFGAAANVAFGTRNLMSFLVYGRNNLLERAREQFRAAVLADASADDQISRWVAAHLLNLSNDLEHSSIWTALPPDVPPNIRKAFAMGSPRVLTLWLPQLNFFNLGEAAEEVQNPLSAQIKRLFISTPTSSGKTLLAQLLVISHLANERTSVCYVAPTRSLCREVRKSLELRLRFVGKKITDGLPEGLEWDTLLDFEPQVEVMTPERLSYLLRLDSSRVLERFGMFIFDEVHTISGLGRGWTLEENLSYLHYTTQNREHRIILISAAVGNHHHFVQWMSKGENRVMHRPSPWRGPRRLNAIWTTEVDWGRHQNYQPPLFPGTPYQVSYPLHGKLDARISHTGKLYSLKTSNSIGNLTFQISEEGVQRKDSSHSTPFYIMLAPIIQHLAQVGPVLVIEATKLNAMRMAKLIANKQQELKDYAKIQPLIDLVSARLGVEHPLWQVLKKGVAYHHGSLPNEIREAIEEAVSRGDLHFLVATTTMTEGVNLPVRSVVIASQGSHRTNGYEEYITGSRLVNAIGRAGRSARETEGIVVLARNTKLKEADFKRLDPEDADMEATSMLATKQALDALASFEELQRAAEDAVFQTNSEVMSDFLSFIWFVAAELDRLGQQPTSETINRMLEYTFGWIQLSPDNQERWLTVAKLALTEYEKTNTSARLRWAAIGSSLSSAREIESIGQELAEKCISIEIPQGSIEEIELIFGEGRLQRILNLPEARKNKFYTHRSGRSREEVVIPVERLLRQWLEGTELVSLAETYFIAVKDVDFRFEQLGDFINNYFEIYLPWVLGTIISWTNDVLRQKNAQTSLSRTLPANIRWGVGNPVALELMIRGIQSRTLAIKIAKSWEAEKRKSDVYAWIRSMSLAEWQQTFEASVGELRTLLEFSKDQSGGIAINLLSEESAKVEVISDHKDFPQSDALLKRIDDWELSPIGVWVNDELVGSVLSRDQADIQSLLNSGLIFLTKFSTSAGKAWLELQLVDPET